jgi:mono/diheme cytochrome c family protein
MLTILGPALVLLAAVAPAPPPTPTPTPAPSPAADSGEALFRSYCAACHGTGGKGDGPIAASLRVAPADLTVLARRNHGKFDTDKVRRAIDGRAVVKPHGNSDMPVWGDAFSRVGEGYSEEKVKARIDALVEYLRSLQVP